MKKDPDSPADTAASKSGLKRRNRGGSAPGKKAKAARLVRELQIRQSGLETQSEQQRRAQGQPGLPMTRTDITERKHTEEMLRDSSRHLRELSQRLIEAEEAVRRRINRELHDRVGASLSAISLSFNILVSKLTPESRCATRSRVDDLQRLLDETISHIRDVMAELHPPALDDYGLLAALHSYAVTMSERFAVPVTVQGEELVPRLPLATETALFRVVQGALANAVTHAHAGRIEILLAPSLGGATLTIVDDGVGFDVAHASLSHASWGLPIMRERAEAVGARLTVESAPGKGACVRVEISRGRE